MKLLRIFILIIAVIYAYSSWHFQPWKRGGDGRSGVLNWDVYGYSIYLSGIIHNDLLELKFLDSIETKYKPCDDAWGYGRFKVPNTDKAVCKYTIGNAYFMSPFYYGAHIYAQNSGKYPADGYSRPYSIGVCVGWIFWACWGLYLLGAVLIRYFPAVVVVSVLGIIALATNFYCYTVQTVGMNHIPLFFCASLCLYAGDSWARTGKSVWICWFMFGLSASVVLRPTELVMLLLLPLLWVFTRKYQPNVKDFLVQKWKQILCAGVVGLLVGLPQLWYWYATTGKFVHYSYQGEHFDFSNPHIWKGLFSYRKGLFVYCPILLASFLGIIPLWQRNKAVAAILLLYLGINVYIIFSWTAWSYGGSLGARSMIQSFAFHAILLASAGNMFYNLYQNTKNRLARGLLAVSIYAILGSAIGLQMIQTIQYHKVIIHWDNMTKESFWLVFGKSELSPEERQKVDELYSRPIVD